MKVTKNLNKVVRGANALSVGISVVVAVLIGVFLGIYFRNLTGSNIAFVVCLLFGIAAAILNIYKAYKALSVDMKELENDPRYKNYKTQNAEFDDDEWGENSQNGEKSQNSEK